MSKKKEGLDVRPVASSLGTPVKVFYGPEDIKAMDYEKDVGDPGEYPFTRAIYPTMYRSTYWTMRQYSGQATSESTNERFKFLLKNGQTGLSLAFDLPTQIGLDSDDPFAEDDVESSGSRWIRWRTSSGFSRAFPSIKSRLLSRSTRRHPLSWPCISWSPRNRALAARI